MRIQRSAQRLERMLGEAGVDLLCPPADSLAAVLSVFREFCEIEVRGLAQDDGDGVLAQFGTWAFDGPPTFEVDLTRQLTERGVDPPIWQVQCTLHWEPSAETDRLGFGERWSFGVAPDKFFADVVQMPGFAWAMNCSRPPESIRIELDQAC